MSVSYRLQWRTYLCLIDFCQITMRLNGWFYTNTVSNDVKNITTSTKQKSRKNRWSVVDRFRRAYHFIICTYLDYRWNKDSLDAYTLTPIEFSNNTVKAAILGPLKKSAKEASMSYGPWRIDLLAKL